MKADGWCCTICGKFDLREHPEQLAKPYHVSHRGVDIGDCPGKFMPFVWLSRMTDGEGGEQADSTGEPVAETSREPAAPDATLDEIVRDANEQLRGFDRTDIPIIRAACIRARETDPKLAAVRAWRERWARGDTLLIELDAILDGKGVSDAKD